MAFVQPEGVGTGRDPALCITTDTLRGLEADPEALAPAQCREVERLAREYQFFHWHLAFPEVFEGGDGGGFDCVLGNPPWEHTELKEKEWFAERNPQIAGARTGAERKRLIENLKHDDPVLYGSFAAALRQHEHVSHLLRNTGRFPHCGRERVNYYAVFADPERRFTLSLEDITLLNPNTRTCPTFRSRSDAELAKAIYRRVAVLLRKADDGRSQSHETPWGIQFRQGLFNMTSDSHLFRTKEQLEADGWELSGNVFRKCGTECFPLYEAKLIYHFDHRWASYGLEDGKDVAVVVPSKNKQDPGFAVLPRYWVTAREVYLRVANLPKGLLAALRDRNAELIALAVCHLLFQGWLYRGTDGSAEAAITEVFPSWADFVAYHPVALDFAPTQMGLCGNSPACIAPLGPSYLPAEPLNEIEADPRSCTAWYAVDPSALRESFTTYVFLITTQAKRNLSSRSGIGGVLSAT